MFAFYILFERKLLKDYLSVKLNDTFFMQAQGTSKDLVGLKRICEWPLPWNKFSFQKYHPIQLVCRGLSQMFY